MKKGMICLLLLAAFFTQTRAQSIDGRVMNKHNEAIPYATVVIQTPDSLYLNSALTDSAGAFSLASQPTAYRLIVQHLGYEPYEGAYTHQRSLTIQLTEKDNLLEEITIRAERPLVKLKEGRITYDMSQLLSGKAVSNAYESLLQLPGVREQGGTLALAGSSSVTVIINGQLSSMPYESLIALLKSYPAERVKRAEIMYSAPPQYHIRGAAINLELKSASLKSGIQGLANASYTQKQEGNYGAGLSLLIPFSKGSLDLNYAFAHNRSKPGVDLYSDHQYNGVVHAIEQHNRGGKQSSDHHLRLAFDYNWSDASKFTLAYTTQLTPYMNNNEWSKGTLSDSHTQKRNELPIQMHNLLFNWQSGFGLKTGIEYTFYKNRTRQQFTERIKEHENSFVAIAQQRVNRYRLFADQTHALTTAWSINYGAQLSLAGDAGSQTYDKRPELNASTDLREYTTQLYAGLETKVGEGVSLSASLTSEYYKHGQYDEWSLFPAMELTWMVAPSHILQASLSTDKVYPAYWETLGAVGYLNGYSEIRGNPLLKPSVDYSAQLNWILKGKYILTAFYNYHDNYFMQLPFQSPDRLVLIYQTQNTDYKQTAGVNLIVPFRLGNPLDSRLTLSGFYDKVQSSQFHHLSYSRQKGVFYARLDNTLNISSKPNIKLELNGAYLSKSMQGAADLSDLWNLEAGIKWIFLGDRAELKLRGTDLLNRWTPNLVLNEQGQSLRMNIIPDTRAVSLGFTFRFGGYKKSNKQVDASRFGVQ